MAQKSKLFAQIQSMIFSVMALVLFGTVGLILLNTIEPNPRKVNYNLPPNEEETDAQSMILTSEDDPSIPAGWKRYVNAELEFSMLFPDDWSTQSCSSTTQCFTPLSLQEGQRYPLVYIEKNPYVKVPVTNSSSSKNYFDYLNSLAVIENPQPASGRILALTGKDFLIDGQPAVEEQRAYLEGSETEGSYGFFTYVNHLSKGVYRIAIIDLDPATFELHENEMVQMRESFEFID